MPKISEALRGERRESILQAAVQSLAAHGYSGTSMRTIAEAAGLTKGGLYAYYQSKEAILLEVASRYMEQQLSEFRPLQGETAQVQLDRMLTAYQRSADDLETARVQRAILDLWTFAGEMPTVREGLAERYARYLATTAEIIRRGQGEGSFRTEVEPELVAGLILSARDGMVYQAIKLGLSVPVQALSDLLHQMVDQFLKPHR